MHVVIVNRAPHTDAPKQWTILVPLDWNTNGVATKEVAEQACVKLRAENQGIECKVQVLADVQA